MTAAPQRERKSGSRRGAHGEIDRLHVIGSCIGVCTASAMLMGGHFFNFHRHRFSKRPLATSKSSQCVNDQSKKENHCSVANLLQRIWTFHKNEYEASDRDQSGHWKQPHAKWTWQIRTTDSEHDHADCLHKELQQDSDH